MRLAAGWLLAVSLLAPASGAVAHWRWGGGMAWGPAYPHDAPHHYAPPPPASEGCYAGAWVCPLDRPALVGQPCGCPTGQGTAWGQAR